jgi:uncharacterized protein YqeY
VSLYNPRPSAYLGPVPLSEQQLADDLVRAMKAREALRVSVLRGVIAAVKNLRVERRGAVPAETDLVQIVRREMRKREEAAEFAVKAGRDELVAQNRAEREVLAGYVPSMLEADELERAIRVIATETGPAMGTIMAALRERYAGRFDGRQASEIARRVAAETAS